MKDILQQYFRMLAEQELLFESSANNVVFYPNPNGKSERNLRRIHKAKDNTKWHMIKRKK